MGRKKNVPQQRVRDEAVLRITAQYVAQVQKGRQPCLSEYLARYPQYSSAIADFVAYYHAIEAPQNMSTAEANEELLDVSRTTRKDARVYRYASHTRIPAGITTLFTRIDGQRIGLSHLATKLALSATIVMQLEHRMIDPESIPQELCRRLADILQQPVPSVRAYFAGHNPADSAHVQQKVAEQQATYLAAESTDVQQRQAFRMVVALSDELSEEQRSFWRNVIEQEKV